MTENVLLRSTERIPFASFYSRAGFTMLRGCQVISGFRCHLGLTDTLGLDLMLVSIQCYTR